MLGSGGPLDPHDAQSGVKVYVDVYDQTFRPRGECAKIRHCFCRYGDAVFNLDSHVVAIAEKNFFHILDCVGWVPHVSPPKRRQPRLGAITAARKDQICRQCHSPKATEGLNYPRQPERMSALPPKADIGTQSCNVRFVPKAAALLKERRYTAHMH